MFPVMLLTPHQDSTLNSPKIASAVSHQENYGLRGQLLPSATVTLDVLDPGLCHCLPGYGHTWEGWGRTYSSRQELILIDDPFENFLIAV